MTLQRGDRVYLASGSPVLEVRMIHGNRVLCTWKVGQTIVKDWFVLQCLRKYMEG